MLCDGFARTRRRPQAVAGASYEEVNPDSRMKGGFVSGLSYAIRLTVVTLCALGCFVALAASVRRAAAAGSSAYVPYIPRGIPKSSWLKRVPSDNRLTAEKVSLGEALYYDKRLSADGTLSCATCHDPAKSFASADALTVGVNGRVGVRNAPTVLNAMFSDRLFWDGRASSLEEQVKHPLVNPDEMGMPSLDAVVARVGGVPDYRRRFRRVFGGGGITIGTIAKAIAAYERTRLSGNSPFDRFIAGERGALTEPQRRGWELFRQKARCITCHTFDASSPFFTDNRFHNTGAGSAGVDYGPLVERTRRGSAAVKIPPMNVGQTAQPFELSGLGRYLVTGSLRDVGAFKTPTLRDVELTTPYMHDGSEKTLLDVVKFYNRGGRPNPYLDGEVRPLNLTEGEMNDLVEFMRALTSDDVLRLAQNTSPQTREPALAPFAQARDLK